jgi:hypothetical protein
VPIFLDRHDVGEVSAEDVAKLHAKDLEVQDKYRVKFFTYWYDAERMRWLELVGGALPARSRQALPGLDKNDIAEIQNAIEAALQGTRYEELFSVTPTREIESDTNIYYLRVSAPCVAAYFLP